MEFIRFIIQVSWKHIIIASIAGLVSGCANAMLISIINHSVQQGYFKNALVIFATLCIFILVTSVISQFVLITLSQNAIYELRIKLSRNILSSPLEHLERLKENRLIATLTDDVRTLAHAVSAVPNICIDLATVIGCFVYLAWVSGILFALTIVSTVAAIGFVQMKLNKAQVLMSKARDEEDTLFKHFKAIISGTKELKLHRQRREEFVRQNLEGSAHKVREKNTVAMKSFAVANGFGQFSQFASLGFILFILPSLVQISLPTLATYVLTSTFIALPMQNLLHRVPELLRGNIALRKIERMKLTLQNLAEAETIPDQTCDRAHLELRQVTYMYHPEDPHAFASDHPEGLGQGHPQHQSDHPEGLSQGHPQHQDVVQIYHPNAPSNGQVKTKNWLSKIVKSDSANTFPQNHPPHPQGQNNGNGFPPPKPTNGKNGQPMFPPPPHHFSNGGQFMGIPDTEPGFLLGPINLSFAPGEITFIVGGNGSGKSTLAKLITGLYSPHSGTIYLNGKAISDLNVEWYRQHFATVFSDYYLFDSYLGFQQTNLDVKVQSYLESLQLDHKVKVKNGVLSTTNLSSGQRKRLALLSAFLEDRPIYLFDEWASDQEPLFRDLFYKKILANLKKRRKNVIIISHDDRYFHLADHIIKLDYGKIEFDRSHKAVVNNKQGLGRK
jgi:putative pyoverdin transport system ATP-binding/permease protein